MTTITVVTRAQELERVVPEWTELAEDTAEPNVFYAPLVLVPAVQHLAQGSDVRVLFVRSGDGRLVGVVPLERHRWSFAVPAPHFSLWRHPYCFLTTPLVRTGFGEAVVEAVLAWLDEAGIAGRFLRLLGYAGGGAFDEALEACARRRGHVVRASGGYERPFAVAGVPAERYLEATVSTKRRSELRRKKKRLGDHGEVAVVGARTPAELEAWLPRFLELEDRGWKGKAGSSLASSPRDRAFVEAMARRGGPAHRMDLVALTLGGAPVAMAMSLRSGGAVFAFKIAYDEQFGPYSPGALVELEFMRRILEDPTTRWADSCAAADYASLDTLWADRRVVRDADLVHASRLDRGIVAIGEPLEELATATRAWVRGLPPSVQRPLRQVAATLRGG